MPTVLLTITRAGASDPEPVRRFEHDSHRAALDYVRRVIVDACRWGAGDVYDVELYARRWRVFGPRAGCGGRPEIMTRSRGERSWQWLSPRDVARGARIAPERRTDSAAVMTARDRLTSAGSPK
jgi:hypothetical protein